MNVSRRQTPFSLCQEKNYLLTNPKKTKIRPMHQFQSEICRKKQEFVRKQLPTETGSLLTILAHPR